MDSFALERLATEGLSLLTEIDELIKARLPDILELADPSDASQLARILREEVQSRLIGPSGWRA